MFHAKMFNNNNCHVALNLNCVVFNVDYRLGPEAKAPAGQLDFAAVVKHVYKNAGKYGVNKSQICIGGCSGGGWVALGAANQMVKSGDIHMAKALFINTGMISDETYGLPDDKLKDYEYFGESLTSGYRLLATDFENQ